MTLLIGCSRNRLIPDAFFYNHTQQTKINFCDRNIRNRNNYFRGLSTRLKLGTTKGFIAIAEQLKLCSGTRYTFAGLKGTNHPLSKQQNEKSLYHLSSSLEDGIPVSFVCGFSKLVLSQRGLTTAFFKWTIRSVYVPFVGDFAPTV